MLNLPNRGVKTRSLIVLNNTVMQTILIECLFADSYDADMYDPEAIARAIICGLIGAENSSEEEWKLGWNRNSVGWWYCTSTKNKYYYTSQNGWKEIYAEWYIFDSRGYALQDSWYHDENNNDWYYLDEKCKMVRCGNDKPLWKWIDGGCYAFDEGGKIYHDCITADGWQADRSGLGVNN